MDRDLVNRIRSNANLFYELTPEERELYTRQTDLESKLRFHPAARGIPRPRAVEELDTIRVAKAGLKFADAKRKKEAIDELTSKFSRLSISDQTVMNAVRRRSIFHTDRGGENIRLD